MIKYFEIILVLLSDNNCKSKKKMVTTFSFSSNRTRNFLLISIITNRSITIIISKRVSIIFIIIGRWLDRWDKVDYFESDSSFAIFWKLEAQLKMTSHTLDSEMLSLLETLKVLLVRFASMALESTVLCLSNLAWLLRILWPKQNFNPLVTVLRSTELSPFEQMFWVALAVMTQFGLLKQVSELDFVESSSVQLSNHSHCETIHHVAVHHLSQYYQPQLVPWIASVLWYMCCKLICTKILQNV